MWVEDPRGSLFFSPDDWVLVGSVDPEPEVNSGRVVNTSNSSVLILNSVLLILQHTFDSSNGRLSR